MTCDEFRKLPAVMTDKATTRGERAAIVNHYLACKLCRDFSERRNEAARAEMTPERYAELASNSLAMAVEDVADPEFDVRKER